MPTRNINHDDHPDAEYTLRLERLREAVRIGEEAFARGDFVEIDQDDIRDFIAGLGRQAAARVNARRSKARR